MTKPKGNARTKRKPHYIPDEKRRAIKAEILEKILQGQLENEVRRWAQETHEIAYDTAKSYVADVYEQIRSARSKLAGDHDLNTSLACIRLQKCINEAMKDREWKAVSDFMKQLHALQGLVTPTKAGININVGSGVGGHLSGPEGLRSVPTHVLEADFEQEEQKRLPAPPKIPPRRLTAEEANEFLEDDAGYE